jgi:hypothetical protein
MFPLHPTSSHSQPGRASLTRAGAEAASPSHPPNNNLLVCCCCPPRTTALLCTRPQLPFVVNLTDTPLIMRHPLSFLPIFLLLIISVSIEAFVVPWSRSDNAQFSPTQRHQSTEPQPYKSRNVLPNLTWLRDFTIEKVFGIPRKPAKVGTDRPGSLLHPLTSQLPNTLLAKYGGDVVLRFNMSTPYEEKELAEAADTLFLDVWAFTNNWADIRLREEDVRSTRLKSAAPHILTTFLGPITPWVTAEITAEGIFESDAGLGEHNLPVIPLDRLCRSIHTRESCGPFFHTCFEDVRGNGQHFLPRLSTIFGYCAVDEAYGVHVHNSRTDDQHRDDL